MKLINFTAPRPQFSDVNGDPLALGRVSFYSAGTPTLKTVYSDADKTAAAPNPQTLDAGGFVQDGGVWLDEGRYKVIVEKSNGAGGWTIEYTIDDIPGTPGVPGELTAATIGTIADLRLLDPGAFGAVFVSGYYEGADRGEGWFLWDANNSTADNGGTIISPNGAPSFGRWKRLIQQSKIIPQIFGAMTNTSFGVSSNMQSMIDWCNTAGNEEYLKVRLDPGNYFIDGNVAFDNNIDLEVADGAIFDNHAATSGTLTITCQSAIIEAKTTAIVGTDISLVFNPTDISINLNPAWYGPSTFEKLEIIADPANLGVRDLDVYTLMEIEGGVTTGNLDFNNMYFYDGGVFNIQSTAVTVNIGEIRAENRVATSSINFPIFVSEFENVRIANGDIYISWFAISTATKYDQMLSAITYANTKPRILKWNIAKSLPGGNSTNYNVNHDFSYGGSISCTSNVLRFNSITAGNIQIFDIASGGKYQILSGVIFPEWFGAFPYDGAKVSNNVNAFNFIFDNWPFASLCYIDGRGATYFLNGSISVITNQTFKMRNIKLSEFTLSFGTFFDIDGPAEFKNVDFYSNAPTILKTTTTAEHDISFENCTFTSDETRGIVDVKGPMLGNNLEEKRADFLNCRFESTTLECGNAFVTNSFFLYSNIVHEIEGQTPVNSGLKFLNNTLQSIDGRLSTIELKGRTPGNVAIVNALYVLNNNWIDRIHDITASYDTMFATNLLATSHKADVYDNYTQGSGAAKVPTTRPFGRREILGAGPSFALTLDANETFLAAGSAPQFGSVCGAGNWTGLTSGLIDVSFEGAYSQQKNTFPDVTCHWQPVGIPFGNDIVINYNFINTTNQKVLP